VCQARLWSNEGPRDKRENCCGDYCGDENGGDFVGKTLHRGAAALRFADESYDLRERGFASDAFASHDEAAAGVERAAGELVADGFFYWHWFAGDHGFVYGAGAFEQRAIYGDAFSWPNAKAIAFLYEIERNILFGVIVAKAMRGLRH
jgi:hypothetical protein